MSASIDRRNLIRALVQTRIGPSPRARKRKWRLGDAAKRRALGWCRDCNGAPPVAGTARCESCRAKHIAANRARYQDRVSRGLCGSCPGNAVQGRTLCAKCAEKNRLEAIARRAAQRQGRTDG